MVMRILVACGLYVGRYPPQLSLYSDPPPLSLSLTHLMAHATSSQTFSRTISYPSSFYSHLPAYEDVTDRVFRNVGI